jgi:mannose-6-phosphate isomerase
MTTSDTRDANDWASWFWDAFFAAWLASVQDGDDGVFDALDESGKPDPGAGKSLLAQARTLFTVSHLGLLSGDPKFANAAQKIAAFMEHFRKARGLYRNKINRDGTIPANAADDATRSYDLTFVILGLVTWNKLSPSEDSVALIDDCWRALQSELTDHSTGLLLNDDTGTPSNPAQNPHMHLYEASLQAYQMTNEAVWLERAARLREIGLRHFMDDKTGSIAEFLTPDLQPLPGEQGQRREIGHQCEWA